VNRRRDSVRIEPRISPSSGGEVLDARRRAASAVQVLPGRNGPSGSDRCLVPGGRRFASSDAGRCAHPRRSPSARRRSVWPGRRKLLRCGTERLQRRSFFGFNGGCREESEKARVPSSLEKDLEGERSPGRIGRSPAGNGWRSVTDLTAEQGLEADAPVRQTSTGRFWQRSRSGEASRAGGNGKGATATVTWCGCRRGESFEGCENRRGEGIGTPDGTWIRPGAGWEPESQETR
jgi:hypothetical protein